SVPLACCTHAVLEKASVRAGDVVVVVGPGAIGLLTAQIAVASGAQVVMAGTGTDAPRLELARELGTQHAIDVEAQPAADFVNDLTGGQGADVVFECSGAAGGARLGYELVRRGGQFVQVGLFGKRIEMDADLAVLKEVDVRNSFASTWKSWDHALKLLGQGRVRTRPLVTDALPLDGWEKAFTGFRNKEGIKYVLLPGS
ncbi:MAG: zinc-binding dehydrogenase, partial [Chloroflexi bacterium]|nr:zinc-binding dehydrogenase [Chloroflexota bacterium]